MCCCVREVRHPGTTLLYSSAASDGYKGQALAAAPAVVTQFAGTFASPVTRWFARAIAIAVIVLGRSSAVLSVTVTARVALVVVVVAALFALLVGFQLLAERAIGDLLVMDGLEVSGEHVEGLALQDLAGFDVLGSVKAVVAHVEPLHLETWGGVGNVACW